MRKVKQQGQEYVADKGMIFINELQRLTANKVTLAKNPKNINWVEVDIAEADVLKKKWGDEPINTI